MMTAVAMRVSKSYAVKPGPQSEETEHDGSHGNGVSKNYAVIPGPQSEETEHYASHGNEGK